MNKLLKDIVKEKMLERKMTVPDLARETSIPASRIYKWYDQKTPANPKEGDAEILKQWLNRSMEEVQTTRSGHEKDSIRSLSRAIESLSADKERTTALIERMFHFIERNFNSDVQAKVGQSLEETGTLTATPPGPENLDMGKKYRKGTDEQKDR